MSALLVDDMIVAVPTRSQPRHWRHVGRGPQARPVVVDLPGGRPDGVAAPQLGTDSTARPAAPQSARTVEGSWQLTDRGIAVVVVFFLAVVAVSAAVLVGAFFSVSDAPLDLAPRVPAAAAAQG